jgi:hypothetical protein
MCTLLQLAHHIVLNRDRESLERKGTVHQVRSLNNYKLSSELLPPSLINCRQGSVYVRGSLFLTNNIKRWREYTVVSKHGDGLTGYLLQRPTWSPLTWPDLLC